MHALFSRGDNFFISTNLVKNARFSSIGFVDFNICNFNLQQTNNFVSSNCFIRKVWNSHKIFYSRKYFFFDKFKTVHSTINFLKSWDVNICFFLTGKVICPFSEQNLSHLRNIFIKNFAENIVWSEIEKMFNSGVLTMSNSNIYWGGDLFSFSFLSRFLLEIYFSELDTYISKVLIATGYFCNLVDKKILSDSEFPNLLLHSIPIKLGNNLKLYRKLSIINNLRFNTLFSHFNRVFSSSYSRNFKKNFNWVRYVNYLLFGFVASKNYSYFLFEKILSFVRSNLLCDIKDIVFNSSFEKNVYFLGFNIFLVNKFTNPKIPREFEYGKKYTGRLLNRITFYRKKLFNLISKRYNSDLFSHFISLFKKKVTFNSSSFSRVWTYIFQLECVRSLQFGKLLFSNDFIDNLSHPYFFELRSKKIKGFVFYRKYSLNLYLRKLHFLFKDVITSFGSYFNDSVLPFDIVLYKFTFVFQKKILFFYENLYINKLDFNLSYAIDSRSQFFVSKIWKISVPSSFLFKKLRTWGIIHPYKDRPIGNSKFLLMDDGQIIKNFSYISNQVLIWFRCSDDFSLIKFFVEIIRQSCFLTLCRKHNKSKAWAYSVYTPSLMLGRKLDFSKVVFLDRKFVLKLNKKFLTGYSIFSFNEKFFLIN